MDKTGEVRVGITPCDVCGAPASVIRGSQARCSAHPLPPSGMAKHASECAHLKSFTEPLDPVSLVLNLQEED